MHHWNGLYHFDVRRAQASTKAEYMHRFYTNIIVLFERIDAFTEVITLDQLHAWILLH